MDKKDEVIVYLDELTVNPAPGEDKLWDRLTELREEYRNNFMSFSIKFNDTYTNSNSRMLSRSSQKKYMDLQRETKRTLDEIAARVYGDLDNQEIDDIVEAEIEHHQLGEDK